MHDNAWHTGIQESNPFLILLLMAWQACPEPVADTIPMTPANLDVIGSIHSLPGQHEESPGASLEHTCRLTK